MEQRPGRAGRNALTRARSDLPAILCSVRDCRTELAPSAGTFTCARGHSFDLARSGYLNLLQPQDRRSRSPGDSPGAVAARRRFIDRGFADALNTATAELLPCEADAPVLDVGSGEGAFLGELARRYAIDGYGVDLSTAAADLAARRYRSCRWIVANADRFIPFGDESLDAVTSINARLNPDEFARVLRPAGRLLLAIAASDDLLEVRERILGAGLERSRVDRTRELFEPVFELVHHERVAHRVTLDHEALADVLSSSYRGLRLRERERLASIDSLEVTLSRDVLLFRKAWT